jgi:peptide/nickel transport system permease protein
MESLMGRFLIRRLLWAVFVLLAASAVIFAITHLVPADPARLFAGPDADIGTLTQIRHELGLDDPLPVRYWRYVERLIRGDLGRSWQFKEPVLTTLATRLPATIELLVAGLLCQLALGLPVGLLSALYRNSWLDRLLMTGSFILLAAPGFVLGLLLLYVFGFLVPVLPLGGYGGLTHLVLPATTMGLVYFPWYARMFRATVLDVLDSDYLRTARAKGLADSVVLIRHALPNAIRPVITMAGFDLGNFLGGLVVIEAVFGWPGIGSRAVEAISFADIPVVVGVVLVASGFTVLMNVVVDVTYRLIDPRVDYD